MSIDFWILLILTVLSVIIGVFPNIFIDKVHLSTLAITDMQHFKFIL